MDTLRWPGRDLEFFFFFFSSATFFFFFHLRLYFSSATFIFDPRLFLCKDSRQDSGHSNFSYGRYAEKRFPQIYRDLYRDAMLVPT